MTGHESLLSLAADLRDTAPRVRDVIDCRRAAMLMERAAEAIERFAACEPDIEVEPGEN